MYMSVNTPNAPICALYVLLRITLMPRIRAYTCYLSHVFARRGCFSLTELTDLTELFGARFEPTERLRHTEFTEASPPAPLRMERGVVCEVTPISLLLIEYKACFNYSPPACEHNKAGIIVVCLSL